MKNKFKTSYFRKAYFPAIIFYF